MKNDQSILKSVLGSIPLAGPALLIFHEQVEMGTSQYGKVIGLMRGMAMGLVIALMLLVASEAAIAVFEVGRFWITVHITSKYTSAIGAAASRAAIAELNRDYYDRQKAAQRLHDEPGKPKEEICPTQFPIPACLWRVMDKSHKLEYLLGINDGSAGTEAWKEYFRSDLTFADKIAQLDEFYKDSRHATISVVDALREGVKR